MKLHIKKVFIVFLTLIMIFTLSVPAFATNTGYNRGYQYSTAVYHYNVTLKDKGWEAITVVNTCNIPLEVHVGGVYQGVLNKKNSELTVWIYKANKNNLTKRVKIDPLKTGTHTFRIKTTGYKDVIKKVY